MKKAFRASRLIGLFGLVLGVMAFGATAAQAELNAHWNINKMELKSPLLPEIQAVLENNDGILLTKVGLSKVELLCTALKLVGAKLHELGRATGKIHFSGCITKLNGTTSAACVPHSPGAPNGLIETNALKGLIKLHTPATGPKVPALEVLPETGEVYVTLILGKAAPEKNECAIGEKFDFKGNAFIRDGLGKGETELVTHLFEVEPTLTKLLYGANPATLDGSANVSLAGAPHAGLTWDAIPG